jgi:[protein-PII] uridylyltransferase
MAGQALAKRLVTELAASTDDFRASLPDSYRRNFDARASDAHFALSSERGERLACIGTFPSPRPGTALCVTAEDRPGLLATISAALVLCHLDVIEAEAYTRRRPGYADEAVDVFWVRHDPQEKRGEPISPEDVQSLETTLIGLLEGKLDRNRLADPTSRRPSTPGSVETVVRFIEDREGSFATLEVETGDRSGLLLSLAQALFNQRVQIVSSQVKTNGSRVFDRFSIVELDGSPISAGRRLEIQVAVLTAVDPVALRANASNVAD